MQSTKEAHSLEISVSISIFNIQKITGLISVSRYSRFYIAMELSPTAAQKEIILWESI